MSSRTKTAFVEAVTQMQKITIDDLKSAGFTVKE
jgi:hypothetical protein